MVVPHVGSVHDHSIELASVIDSSIIASSDAIRTRCPEQICNEASKIHQDTGLPEEPSNPEPVRGKIQVFAIMVALCLSLLIAALDQTIVSTSLPTITSRLHSASGYTWIGAAYLLASAAAAPIWAKISDIWGRKPVLLVAVLWFFLSSIVCAAAVDMEMLIAGRALQGVAGGGLLQLVMIVVSDLFSVRHRSLYMGILEFMWTIAGGLGPILGGVFSEFVSWRWNFWINLPVCGIAFILLFMYLDVHNPGTKVTDGLKAIDWLGSLSILGFTLMVLLGLNFGGETFAWNSSQVGCLLVFGSLFLGVFFYGEKYVAKYPLMPLWIFQNRSNVAVSLVTLFHGAVSIACEYWLPLYFQSAKQASPMQSGFLLLPLVIAEGFFSGISAWNQPPYAWDRAIYPTWPSFLSRRVDFLPNPCRRRIGHIVCISTDCLAIKGDAKGYSKRHGHVRLHPNYGHVCLDCGGRGGFREQHGQGKRSARAGRLVDEIAQQLTGASAAASTEIIKSIGDPSKVRIVADAFSSGLRNLWIMYTCMAGIAVVASAFIVSQPLSEEHTETKTGLKHE
ncbi:hypothetical protein ARAM_000116 [Aspergillus rambellii]|uniref:Major facilitator superfamily (MFS) profile domain-containing protein n=1 Tax=Aspergillus rambellii TaxID=308745 RepID=A0A0F8UZE7_9EURO|nr:hypothetical protein ARAM_000116 [Aspergillus rambellii]